MTPILGHKTSDSVNWIKKVPIAHRGLHDKSSGIFENTLSAAKGAMETGYAIEVDLQYSSDGVPVVFHDYDLKRLTGNDGEVRKTSAQDLGAMTIGESEDRIPALQELLELIQGKVGIVLELKGLPGKDKGFVEAVAHELEGYAGDTAIMSFHHHILEDARQVAPELGLGLTAEGGDEAYEQHVLAVEKYQPDFISYELKNLDTRFVREYTQSNRPSISWTVRSEQDAAISNQFVDQITFEGFRP